MIIIWTYFYELFEIKKFKKMLIKFLIILLLKLSKEKKPISEYDTITPENGFISDNEILSNYKCFKPLRILYIDKYSDYLFISPLTFRNLIKNFGISNLNDRYQFILKSDLLMDYFNEIYEDIYSISLNYQMSAVEIIRHIYEDEFLEKPNEIGINLLTDLGLKIYKENKKEFRLICGDRLIDSYSYGIALLVNVKINFGNPIDKINLLNYMKIKKYYFGKFERVMENIYNIINNTTIIDKEKVFIEIFAFQLGGEDEKINFNKNFLLGNCQFKNIKLCINKTNYISKYINDSFYNQWNNFRSFSEDKLYIMGAVHKNKNKEILKEFGIYVNNSFVNEEIIEKRKSFLSFIKQIKIAKKNLDNFKRNNPESFNNTFKELDKVINNIYSYIFGEEEIVINCYRNVKEFLICSENIISNITNQIHKYNDFYQKIINDNFYFKVEFNSNFCLPKKIGSWKKKNMFLKILKINNELILDFDNTNFICSNIENNTFNCKDSMITLKFSFLCDSDNMKLKCFQEEFNYIEEKNIKLIIP